MKSILACVLAFLTFIGVLWALTGNSLMMTKVFSPQFEQVRRETFEQSKAYNQGMAQEVMAFQQQYAMATDSQKDALASVIIHRTADYDLSKLSPDSRYFIEKLRRGER